MWISWNAGQAPLGWPLDHWRKDPSTLRIERILSTCLREALDGDCLDLTPSHPHGILEWCLTGEHCFSVWKSSKNRWAHLEPVMLQICLYLCWTWPWFPLQKGTWVKYGNKFVFITALYEKLLVFCYKYGHVGHRETNCTFFNNRK